MNAGRWRWGAVLAGLGFLVACSHPKAATLPTPSAPPTPAATPSPTDVAAIPSATLAPPTTPSPFRSAPRTPAPSPSVSRPTPAPSAPSGASLVITQADGDKTFTLAFGSVGELRLDATMHWSNTMVATGSSVQLTPEVFATNPGYQGWRITTIGHGPSVVRSNGAPICQPGQLCAAYVVLFQVTIVVP